MTTIRTLPDGAVVLAGYGRRHLGMVVRSGKLGGAHGHWILSSTGDPGSVTRYPTFAPDWCITPAIIGETVCPMPLGGCDCNLAHLRADELAQVRATEQRGVDR